LFAAFFAAFAVKTPLWPFHTWLPDAYTEAPTTTTVLLAGVMSKLWVYGFLRYAVPLFPDAARWAQPFLLTLAVVGILYCALVATMQRDFKTLVAYSSVSHLGFIVLGIFALNVQGLQGGVFYMVAHGLVIGGLFFVTGMLEERRGTRRVEEVGGLQHAVPRVARGVVLGGLFFVTGMLEERRGTRRIEEFGGLQQAVPRMAGVMLVITLGS